MSHLENDKEALKDVAITLNHDQALVLSDFLFRNEEKISLLAEHPAERASFAVIIATLDKALIEPFLENYDVLVKEARNRVHGEGANDLESLTENL